MPKAKEEQTAAQLIAEMQANTGTEQEIVLSYQDLTYDEVNSLLSVIRDHPTLKTLKFSRGYINRGTAEQLYCAFMANKSLERLMMPFYGVVNEPSQAKLYGLQLELQKDAEDYNDLREQELNSLSAFEAFKQASHKWFVEYPAPRDEGANKRAKLQQPGPEKIIERVREFLVTPVRPLKLVNM
jgi:hypothetical protein